MTEQEQYLAGVYEAKRGHEFDYRSSSSADENPQRVVLRLARDGSALRVLLRVTEQEEDKPQLPIKSVKLVDIRQIVVLSPPENGFSLQLCAPSSNQNYDEHQHEDNPLPAVLLTTPTESAASSAAILQEWVLTLTCGTNAFQQQQLQSETTESPRSMTNLIWQAARLRIFELAHVLPLHEAVALVTLGVHQLLSSDELQALESVQQQQPLLFLSTV